MNALLPALYAETPRGFLNLWTKETGKGKCGAIRSEWFDLAAPAAIMDAEAEALRLDAEGFDVYFGVCPSASRKQGNARTAQKDVLTLPAYFLDVDTQADPAKVGKQLPADPAEALRMLAALPFPPSACVRSGQGVHAYWLFSAAAPVGDNLKTIKANLRAFAEAVARAISCPDLDTFASEPARVLRVPGTHNRKHAEALPVELTEGCTWKRYDRATLDAWARQQTGAENPSPTVEKPPEPPPEAAQRAPVDALPTAPADYQPGGRYYLTDEQLWRVLARRDGRITALRNGDLSAYSGDHSAADEAMCNALAFATGGDPARMDALFRQTLLYRDKWDEIHSATGETYGGMTIRKACEDTRTAYRGNDWKLDKLAEDRRRAFEEVRAAYEKSSGGGYIVEPFHTCAQKVSPNGETSVEPLADFVALPVEDIQRDDGAEVRRELVFEGWNYLGAPLPRVTVAARDLASFRWVDEYWPGAVIEPGNAKRDKLRAAIQKAARVTAATRTVFSHSGWREIGGRWAFLYNGGAVGADGVSVELPGTLAAYTLPEGIPGEPPADAARASLALLDLAPWRVTVPLLATMYLAPLCEWFAKAGEPVTHVLILQGKTQSKKSVLSSLFLCHFGTSWNYQALPFNFQSTANAIREGIFLAKDLPAIVDDFHPSPTGARGNLAAMTQTAQDLCRAWGDHAARQRMNSDQTLRTAKPARGLGIFTAEFKPDLGESGDSRAFVAPLAPGDVADEPLTAAQETARAGVYGWSMRAYLCWIADRVNQPGGAELFAETLRGRFQETRRELLRAVKGLDGHARLATAGAHLLTGLNIMLDYFFSVGAVDDQERVRVYDRAREAILDAQEAHARDVQAADPLRMFAAAVDELKTEYGRFIPPSDATFPGGDDKFCGYMMGGDLLRARPASLFAAVRELCDRSGTPFPISSRELWKRLHDAGITPDPRGVTKSITTAIKLHAVDIRLDKLAALLDADPAEGKNQNDIE